MLYHSLEEIRARANPLGRELNAATNYGRQPLTGAIKLTADVYVKREPTSLNSGDWDNHGKAISDALNGICYQDDRQIIDGHVRLIKGKPHVIIEVEDLT